MRIGLMAAVLALTPGIAHAQDWRVASQGQSTGSTFFLDASTVGEPRERMRGIAFMVLAKPDDGVSAIEAEFEFECATGRRRIGYIQVWDDKEQQGKRFGGTSDWEDTPENTQFGSLWQLICRKTPLPAKSYGAAPPFAAARELGTGG